MSILPIVLIVGMLACWGFTIRFLFKVIVDYYKQKDTKGKNK